MKHPRIGVGHAAVLELLFTLLFIWCPAASAEAQEQYQFKNQWPGLTQPWYFDQPKAIAVDGNGALYVADRGANCVRKLTPDGIVIAHWGTPGSGSGQFNGPAGIAVDASGNVYIVDTGNHRLQKFTSSGST